MVSRLIIRKDESMGDDYVDEKIEQYERKLKQAEKAGKHHKAKKYAEKLERLRAEAAEQSTDSDSDSDDDIDSDDEADNSFALDEEPDVAPRGLKGASKQIGRLTRPRPTRRCRWSLVYSQSCSCAASS